MSPTTNSTSNPVTGNSTSPSSGANPGGDPLANESTFLNLLVSQLQYQDPLNPVDSTEFITQLTGYSQLEQLINIDQSTTTLASAVTSTTTPATGTTSGSGSTPSTGQTTGA